MLGLKTIFYQHRPMTSKDDIGGMIKKWVSIGKVKGQLVTTGSGSDSALKVEYSREVVRDDNYILVGYRANIKPQDVLSYGYRKFKVMKVEDMNLANVALKVHVEEVDTGAI